MWIDIGTPSVSFLVALDAGSDPFWVPCDCVECGPLAASYYSSLIGSKQHLVWSSFPFINSHMEQDIWLNSHQLCEPGPNCPNLKQQCPCAINYYSDDTSTSGFLVEDVLHLMPGHNGASNKSVKAPVIIGCGSKQSGGYLNGVAPDGLLGLGLGEISVSSFLAKAGYVSDSFLYVLMKMILGGYSLGTGLTYVVEVDACCIGNSCLEHTDFEMLVDSGTLFSFFPIHVYKRVVDEIYSLMLLIFKVIYTMLPSVNIDQFDLEYRNGILLFVAIIVRLANKCFKV